MFRSFIGSDESREKGKILGGTCSKVYFIINFFCAQLAGIPSISSFGEGSVDNLIEGYAEDVDCRAGAGAAVAVVAAEKRVSLIDCDGMVGMQVSNCASCFNVINCGGTAYVV